MSITDTCHYLLNDMAKDNSLSVISRLLLCFNVGLLCYNQFCYDKTLLMKRCASILFMNYLFSDLNPRVNILLAGEIFSLHYQFALVDAFFQSIETRFNITFSGKIFKRFIVRFDPVFLGV